ncbi:MAG: hypothetical protein DWQ34_16815 [Planctomycetota bacterium]|nr:MAG: hypothetical protein DWQ29_10000 [Planctomycetota bacterium]REJ90622.1 MAG: hypothetical protein DWQ34_16815 [Planctomycetota bacterium]REK21025.1 MAG: hypothetical protein DWQ41_22770 [Planctomycetota bacterium]REK38843.1 MAG: hypothetical protein DWQ45_03065 [Planctomycetota bacterium]
MGDHLKKTPGFIRHFRSQAASTHESNLIADRSCWRLIDQPCGSRGDRGFSPNFRDLTGLPQSISRTVAEFRRNDLFRMQSGGQSER